MNSEAPLSALAFDPQSIRLGTSYLLTGGDAYLSDLVVDAVRQRLSKHDDIDLFIIYGDEVSAQELYDQLDTLSIFSKAQLLIIRNAHRLDKKRLETLAAYFEAPSEIQTLLIVADKIDARLATWKSIKAACIPIACDPPKYGGALKEWLEKALKNMGKSMALDAKNEYINRVELDYAFAANELTKLDILTGTRTSITSSDVMRSLSTTRTGAVIDFYRALGKRQPQMALDAVDKMLMSDWEALQVFFHYCKFYSALWRILVLRKAHFSEAEIIGKHLGDLFPAQRREFMDFSQRYSLEALEQILGILLETDARLKLSMAEPNVLLTDCLLKVLSA